MRLCDTMHICARPRYTGKATPASLNRINLERVPLFFVPVFKIYFSRACQRPIVASHSRACLALKVAKGPESRYSRSRLASKVASRCVKKSLRCERKSLNPRQVQEVPHIWLQ